MNIKELKNSKFLKQGDVGTGFLATITNVTQENVAPEGVEEDLKWCIHFEELAKPLVCNSTNGQLIAKITGSEESDGWIGKRVVLYSDPNVSYGGKLVGGIRVRAPKQSARPPSRPTQAAPKPAVAPARQAAEVKPSSPTDSEGHPIQDATGEVDENGVPMTDADAMPF